MASFEALYDRRCRSLVYWFKVKDSSILGQEIIHVALEKVSVIRDRLSITYNQRKSYTNNMKCPLEFDNDDHVYINISPMKGVMTFGRKRKLTLMYIGPYHILQRLGEVFFELALPAKQTSVHPIFHVCMLKKCLGNPVSIFHFQFLGVCEDLSYKEVPIEILDRQVKWLRKRRLQR